MCALVTGVQTCALPICTPPGRYRFCVEGRSRQSFAFVPYAFCSNAFVVAPWHGLAVKNLVTDSSGVRFDSDLNYPRSYAGSAFGFVTDNGSPDRKSTRLNSNH